MTVMRYTAIDWVKLSGLAQRARPPISIESNGSISSSTTINKNWMPMDTASTLFGLSRRCRANQARPSSRSARKSEAGGATLVEGELPSADDFGGIDKYVPHAM